jgi:hypothetical protein
MFNIQAVKKNPTFPAIAILVSATFALPHAISPQSISYG